MRTGILLFPVLLICTIFHSCRTNSSSKVGPETLQGAPDTLAVAFYNLENLFDFADDGTEYPQYHPDWFNWTREIQGIKVSNSADVISALGADIIGLCEIENSNAVGELQEALVGRGCVYPYSAVAVTNGATTVALLSRLPLTGVKTLPVELASGGKTRPVLEADAVAGAEKLKLFVNHWPSKHHPESHRIQAASVLLERIGQLPAGTDYLIMGDLNSNYNEHVTFRTEGFDDSHGKTAINHLLRTLVSATDCEVPRYVVKSDLLTDSSSVIHYNPWLDLSEERRRSYVFRGASQTLDHLLLPKALFDSNGYSYLDRSFEVFTWEDRLLRDGVPYRWQTERKGKNAYHLGEGYSDHLPVKLRIVRRAFSGDGIVDKENNVPCTAAGRSGDFEFEKDGWVPFDGNFLLNRDTVARAGRYCMRISGRSPEKNVTVARNRIVRPAGAKALEFDIRGSGKVSFRMRTSDSSWIYFNAPDFNASKSARYKEFRASDWKRIRLPLPADPRRERDVEVEIRAGKVDTFDFRFDQFFVK